MLHRRPSHTGSRFDTASAAVVASPDRATTRSRRNTHTHTQVAGSERRDGGGGGGGGVQTPPRISRGGNGNGGGGTAAAARKGRVSAELTSLAAGYLVSLLKEPEVAQELWPLINRCMDNVAARRSVPASLEVLRRAIATLPAHEAKSWFGGSRSKENRWVGWGIV